MTHTYKQLTSLDRDSQDRVRKRFITYGNEDKILLMNTEDLAFSW